VNSPFFLEEKNSALLHRDAEKELAGTPALTIKVRAREGPV